MRRRNIYRSSEGKVWRLEPFVLVVVAEDREHDRWVVLGYTEHLLATQGDPLRLDVAPSEEAAERVLSQIESRMA